MSRRPLYNKLVELKRQRQADLEQPETIENINISSERIGRIQKRINVMSAFPEGIDPKKVRGMLTKLNQHKNKKIVQKLLRDYTDGEKSQFQDSKFIKSLLNEAGKLSLIDWETTKPTTIKISLISILMKI